MAAWHEMASSREMAGGMNGDILPLRPCARYFWRSHPLNQKSGSAIFATLFQPQTKQSGAAGIATLLESPAKLPSEALTGAPIDLARHSICAGAPRLVEHQYQLWTPEIGEILPFLDRLGKFSPPVIETVPGETQPPPSTLPFLGGWLGWLGYDLAWEIERLPWLKEDSLSFPVAFWYEPAELAIIDHEAQQLWIAAETVEGVERLSALLLAQDGRKQENNGPVAAHSCQKTDRIDADCRTQQLQFETPQAEFQHAVELAKAHIQAGDVFQVNHSLRFRAQTSVPGWEVYQKLHTINPSPFASYWHTPWGQVVSCSPERLVHLASGVAQSRPIAGTRPRGQTPAEDAVNAQVLIGNRKEQAEHIMLVDLERNDLGRVCQWGSVQVTELMTIERYSHVMHLVSNVTGQLQPQTSIAQLVAALFPGGTITGCPKVRCMEIIEALEPVRRSLFYGSCGYFDRRGRLDLNILIRTLLMTADTTPDISSSKVSSEAGPSPLTTVWGQVGAGIVVDSEPEREWQESLQKAKAQLLALGL
ncbi:MAG: anthranilate synthase component I [Phormidesmis sp.]